MQPDRVRQLYDFLYSAIIIWLIRGVKQCRKKYGLVPGQQDFDIPAYSINKNITQFLLDNIELIWYNIYIEEKLHYTYIQVS